MHVISKLLTNASKSLLCTLLHSPNIVAYSKVSSLKSLMASYHWQHKCQKKLTWKTGFFVSFKCPTTLLSRVPHSGYWRLQYFLFVQPILYFYTAMLFLIISIISNSSSSIQLKYLNSEDKSIINHLCVQNTFYKISYGT